jgi:hypothetical protein
MEENKKDLIDALKWIGYEGEELEKQLKMYDTDWSKVFDFKRDPKPTIEPEPQETKPVKAVLFAPGFLGGFF